jgi:hypothetical protein
MGCATVIAAAGTLAVAGVAIFNPEFADGLEKAAERGLSRLRKWWIAAGIRGAELFGSGTQQVDESIEPPPPAIEEVQERKPPVEGGDDDPPRNQERRRGM